MTELEKEEQLSTWLNDQQLGRHADKMKDPNGEVGLTSLADLLELTDEDLNGIADSVNMNMIERKRFMRAAQRLRSPDVQTDLFGAPLPSAVAASPPALEPQAVQEALKPADLDAAIAKEAQDNDQYEVVREAVPIRKSPNGDAAAVGTLGEGRILHAYKERTIGGDNQVWAELTALELKRSMDPGAQASRGFVLIDGSRLGAGLQLRGPLTGEGGVKRRDAEEAAVDAAELQAALTAFSDVPDHADLFEVVWSLVFVNKAPDKDAPRVGALKKGRVIHVKHDTLIGADGKMWVELTNLELWRSCEPEDANDRGFVLVDGSDLGLGQLLKGPLPRDANMWLASRNNNGGARIDPAMLNAAMSKQPLPFDKLGTYADLYEVVHSMVFVKASADANAKTIGVLNKGNIIQAFRMLAKDSQGLDWVELTSHELWRSCKPGNVNDRGFVLIDAQHLQAADRKSHNNPKCLLLEGPLSPDSMKKWQEKQRSEQRSLMGQKQGERVERARDAEQFEVKLKDRTWDENVAVYKYRASRNKVHIKWSDDPRYEWITQSACKPGTVFYSTGMEWKGPNGELWIDGCAVNNKPRWLLAEDPTALGGPYLVEKMFVEQHIYVSVNYMTARGAELFETLIDKNSQARALRERFCKEVNLMSDFVTLKAKFSPNTPHLQQLNDTASLSEQGISSATQLFIEYDGDVFNAMLAGRALGWLSA